MGFSMTYRSPNGRLTFGMQVADKFVAWQSLATIQELFDEECCGKCQSQKIRWNVRHATGRDGDLTFYEIICQDCNAKLEFGLTKPDASGNQRLWAKRTDKDKNVMPDRGWSIYNKPQTQNATDQGNGQGGYDQPQGYDQDQQYSQPPPPQQDGSVPF